MATTTRLTLDEFLSLPEEKPYAEFVRGEVRRKVAPSALHQFIATRIVDLLRAHPALRRGMSVESLRLVYEAGDDSFSPVPDVVYYRDRSRINLGNQYVPPDLAIEIRSPGQSVPWLREKCEYYVAHGVAAAWLVQPDHRTVTVWTAADAPITYSDEETVTFEGFAATVAELLDVSPYLS